MNTTRTLNDIMEFDHVVRVNADGSIDETITGVSAPELTAATDDDGQLLSRCDDFLQTDAEHQGWSLLTGFTGQYGYNGPLLHPSEYVGGGLERHIRETPGLYCTVVIETSDDDEEPAGWVVAYRES